MIYRLALYFDRRLRFENLNLDVNYGKKKIYFYYNVKIR
jgi:hypothetical protein